MGKITKKMMTAVCCVGVLALGCVGLAQAGAQEETGEQVETTAAAVEYETQSPTILVSQGIAFVLSVLWSFYWNNKVVFADGGGERNLWKALAKTYVSYSFTGLFLNSILLVLWVQVFHISEFIAPVINLLISVPLNFLMNKLWAFKE